MSFDDQTLVKHSLSGDKLAFEELVKRYTPRVFRIIYRFVADTATVEDIAQEIFLKAYRSLNTYSRQSPFENWLSAITLNACYRYLQTKKAQKTNLLTDFTAEEHLLLDRFCLTPSYTAVSNPERIAALRDLAGRIMQRLSVKEQMILTLMEVEGMTLQEIAHLWGMSVISVKVQAHRARKHARKVIKDLAKTPKILMR